MSRRLCCICHRPERGQPLRDGEHPCHVPRGQRCYELGFERAVAVLRRVEERLGFAADLLPEVEEQTHGV